MQKLKNLVKWLSERRRALEIEVMPLLFGREEATLIGHRIPIEGIQVVDGEVALFTRVSLDDLSHHVVGHCTSINRAIGQVCGEECGLELDDKSLAHWLYFLGVRRMIVGPVFDAAGRDFTGYIRFMLKLSGGLCIETDFSVEPIYDDIEVVKKVLEEMLWKAACRKWPL